MAQNVVPKWDRTIREVPGYPSEIRVPDTNVVPTCVSYEEEDHMRRRIHVSYGESNVVPTCVSYEEEDHMRRRTHVSYEESSVVPTCVN